MEGKTLNLEAKSSLRVSEQDGLDTFSRKLTSCLFALNLNQETAKDSFLKAKVTAVEI